MNNYKTNNKAVFNYLKKTFPFTFKDITFSNNCITYNGQSIVLDNFDLEEFLNYNSYIIRDLASKEIWEILQVHVKTINNIIPPTKALHETTLLRPITIEGLDLNNNNEDELIALDRFIYLVNQEQDYSDSDKKELNKFFSSIKELMIYEDYLIPSVQKTLNSIKDILAKVEVDG